MMMKQEEQDNDKDPVEQDRELASLFTKFMMRRPEARQALKDMSSKSPTAPAMVAAQAMIKAREALIGNGMEVDDTVWVGGGGVLDELLEDIADDIGIPDNEQGAQALMQLRSSAIQTLEKYEAAGKDAKPQQQEQAPAPMGGALMPGGM